MYTGNFPFAEHGVKNKWLAHNERLMNLKIYKDNKKILKKTNDFFAKT